MALPSITSSHLIKLITIAVGSVPKHRRNNVFEGGVKKFIFHNSVITQNRYKVSSDSDERDVIMIITNYLLLSRQAYYHK